MRKKSSDLSRKLSAHSDPWRIGTGDEMQPDDTQAELMAIMLEIGRTDRELYRQLRAEIWALAAKRHGEKTPEQIATWLEGAS